MLKAWRVGDTRQRQRDARQLGTGVQATANTHTRGHGVLVMHRVENHWKHREVPSVSQMCFNRAKRGDGSGMSFG